MAIYDKENLVISKKFLKFCDTVPEMKITKEKLESWNTY
jgi:hypothetical protein